MPVRRSLWPRVVVFVALLCILGLISTGCKVFVSITIGFGDGFFDKFAREIEEENTSALWNYYANYVFVVPMDRPASEWSRAQIIQEWDDYFARYRILECRIMEETERDSYGDIAIVDIWRREKCVNRLTGEEELVDVWERFTLHDVSGDWKIASVWVKNEIRTRL